MQNLSVSDKFAQQQYLQFKCAVRANDMYNHARTIFLRDRNQKIKLEDALQRYMKTVSILKKGYEQERYRIVQICRSPLASMWVHEVESVDIAAYRDMRLMTKNKKTGNLLSPSTVRLEMSLLSNFFELSRIEWGYTKSDNPCANVRKPKPAPSRDRRLTNREDRLIHRYAHNHKNIEFYVIIVLALTTAMRQGEILSLCWENIDFKKRIAHLPDTKNGTKRNVPFSMKARKAIALLKQKTNGRVFSYTSSGLKSTWRFMLQKLQIEDLHFHDLRHEAISRMFELGTLDMMEIAKISGHKSISMLKRYTHLDVSRLVHKLEGNRSKAKLAILKHFVPYPGIVKHLPEGSVRVHFPDFSGGSLYVEGANNEQALRMAADALVRELLNRIQNGSRLPPPDHYLEEIDEKDIVMIDPLFV